MATRIYSIESQDQEAIWLVEASTKAAALRHIANDFFRVKVADQKTLVAAMKEGVKIEVAGEDRFAQDEAAE